MEKRVQQKKGRDRTTAVLVWLLSILVLGLIVAGGLYAREFRNAVAVGVTQPGRPDKCHVANECILLSEMLFNTRFMAESLKRLAAE